MSIEKYEVEGTILNCFCSAHESIGRQNERLFLCQMEPPHQRFWYNPKTKSKDLTYESRFMKAETFVGGL